MKINLNQEVKVKITEYGHQILRDEHRAIREMFPSSDLEYKEPKVDDEGYSVMQMHNVMSHFGKYMYMGAVKLPIEMAIVVDENNLL